MFPSRYLLLVGFLLGHQLSAKRCKTVVALREFTKARKTIRYSEVRSANVLLFKFQIPHPEQYIFDPPAQSPVFTNGLWNRSTFEIFLRSPDGYNEFNLSSSGDWAFYKFHGYREMVGTIPSSPIASHSVKNHRGLLEVSGKIILSSPSEVSCPSCVLLQRDNLTREYFAEEHFSDRPDFHLFGPREN